MSKTARKKAGVDRSFPSFRVELDNGCVIVGVPLLPEGILWEFWDGDLGQSIALSDEAMDAMADGRERIAKCRRNSAMGVGNAGQ